MKLLPQSLLSDKEAMQGLSVFSMPIIRAVGQRGEARPPPRLTPPPPPPAWRLLRTSERRLRRSEAARGGRGRSPPAAPKR